jgi:hypothetical protein
MDIGTTAEVLSVLAGAVRRRRGGSRAMACSALLRRRVHAVVLNPM